MQIRQITKQSIDQAIALYTEAFPKIERRPVAQWLDWVTNSQSSLLSLRNLIRRLMWWMSLRCP